MSARPALHVTPPRHWLNDPVGALRWRGRYHLFFQYNPGRPTWGRPRWGHVSSADLATWRRHPVALEPDDDGPDRDGCWSGCARVERGLPTIYYTGVVGHTDDDRVESVLRATSTDLDTWRKDARPVLDGAPDGAASGAHRDPFVFRIDGRRHLILGSSVNTVAGPAGAVLLYTDAGPAGWRYDGVLFDGGGASPIDTGTLWECPQLLRIGDRDVLVVSVHDATRAQPMRGAIAFIGRFPGGRFVMEAVHVIDRGDLLYAPTTLAHDGRVLLWGWIRDPRPDLGPSNPGRRVGAISLPRDVRLRAGVLELTLPDEITRLRANVTYGPRTVFVDSDPVVLPDVPPHAEVTFEIEPHGGRVEVVLGPRWDGTATRVAVAPSPQRSAAGRPARVTIIVDADIVEVLAPGLPPHTTRMRPDWRRALTVRSHGAGARLAELTVHRLRPAVEQGVP